MEHTNKEIEQYVVAWYTDEHGYHCFDESIYYPGQEADAFSYIQDLNDYLRLFVVFADGTEKEIVKKGIR